MVPAAGIVMTDLRAMINDMMTAKYKELIYWFAATICIFLFSVAIGCSSARVAPDDNSPGKDCVHCHGEKLQGVKNVKLQCGSCHDLKPLDASAVAAESMKEIITREPHVHKTKNIFSPTPSCFMCHRQTDWQEEQK